MTAFLSWLDHDPVERERSNRILALFQEKESRDELGLGSIRDGLANVLFPGTSTIQTRIRYFLFIPWIYRSMEADGVKSADVGRRLRKEETELVEHLLALGETAGVFGRRARGLLKRLPSSVYWAGLESWGIRRAFGSQEELHRSFDALHQSHRRHRGRREEEAAFDEAPFSVWDPELPAPPAEFPESARLALTEEEAEYLRDRIVRSHPDSLLAWLAQQGPFARVDAPWKHIALHSFRSDHQALLRHGRAFAEAMQGAALLYNLLLAEQKRSEDLVGAYASQYAEWVEHRHSEAMRGWQLEDFYQLLAQHGVVVGQGTRDFTRAWTNMVLQPTNDLLLGESSRALVRARETTLKGGRSRFMSPTALSQWSGDSGLVLMTYRWRVAQQFLGELNGIVDTAEVA